MADDANKLRSSLRRLGKSRVKALADLAAVETELASELQRAQAGDDLSLAEAAREAGLSSRPLAYKIMRRGGQSSGGDS